MAWISLRIEAHDNTAESLSDALMALGALSASIEDANAETPDEQPIFGEPGDPPPGIWQQNIVSALFNDDVDVARVMSDLASETGLSNLAYSVEAVAEQDWVRATQSQFDPIRIRDDLWIVPTWHDAPNPQALNIILDPGLAFGTGSHPTTHLCLAWLADNVRPGLSVLDYGCGSGILAIAARKLGAGRVIGTDIDAQAIEASHYNAAQNQVEAAFYLPDQLAPNQLREEPADLVVANILSSALSVLAPALAAACKHGGSIALSGILREQAEQVSAIYAEWFEMNEPVFLESWVLLTGRRKCAS
ncbi:MAG: ribosomal protein methyltransferase [Pseudomonadota bacterium]